MDQLVQDFEEELDILQKGLSSNVKDVMKADSEQTDSPKVPNIQPDNHIESNDPQPESTLLVVVSESDSHSDHHNQIQNQNLLSLDISTFRALTRASWTLQQSILQKKLQEEIQLVLFHPDGSEQIGDYREMIRYKIDNNSSQDSDSDSDLSINSTNQDLPNITPTDFILKSPYPTFHLLRERDILKGVQLYPEPEMIPGRNRERMEKLGLEKVKKGWERAVKTYDSLGS